MRQIRFIVLIALFGGGCAPPHSARRVPVVIDPDGGVAPIGVGVKAAPNGIPCMGNGDCTSGHCVDHVCCESACGGTCASCDPPGQQGRCLPVPDGQDPDDECAAQPSTSCGLDGTCDGKGACRHYAAGTQCGPGGCDVATERAASTCDGNGQCVPGATKSCSPAVCIDQACGIACMTTGDCQTGFFCDDHTCRTQRAQGAACELDEQCSTGHCADKVCCGTACKDKCYACNLTGNVGTCTAVAEGQDPHNECPVQGIFTCGNAGGCNGRGACRLHVPGTACGNGTTCTGTTLFAPKTCDGVGGCKVGPKSDCSPYVCNGPAVCWTVCANNDQCKAPHVCRNGKCQ